MVIRAPAQRPVELALAFGDRHVVDGGMAHGHQAVLVELPILVAIGAEPVAGVVVPFVGVAHGDAGVGVGPEFLDQAVTAFLSGSYHVRNAAMTAIRRFMQQNEENSFQVCRRVEGMDNSSSDVEQLLYNLVKEEVC